MPIQETTHYCETIIDCFKSLAAINKSNATHQEFKESTETLDLQFQLACKVVTACKINGLSNDRQVLYSLFKIAHDEFTASSSGIIEKMKSSAQTNMLDQLKRELKLDKNSSPTAEQMKLIRKMARNKYIDLVIKLITKNINNVEIALSKCWEVKHIIDDKEKNTDKAKSLDRHPTLSLADMNAQRLRLTSKLITQNQSTTKDPEVEEKEKSSTSRKLSR